MGYSCSSSCYGCGSQSQGAGYSSYVPGSGLENAVNDYAPLMMSEEAPVIMESVSAPSIQHPAYRGRASSYDAGMYLKPGKQGYLFAPEIFLTGVQTEFISCRDEQQKQLVTSMARDAFEKTTGKEMPEDIRIRVCSAGEMAQFHAGWHPGIRGFSINRKGFGISEIFVLEDELARLMLTLGHEIGHVLTFPMKEPVDEEAKAFAFSLAWMERIREENIGGLSIAITPIPAANGLHDVAFGLVSEKIGFGRTALDVYSELLDGEISINKQVPVFEWR